jgi:hypothetical protein
VGENISAFGVSLNSAVALSKSADFTNHSTLLVVHHWHLYGLQLEGFMTGLILASVQRNTAKDKAEER